MKFSLDNNAARITNTKSVFNAFNYYNIKNGEKRRLTIAIASFTFEYSYSAEAGHKHKTNNDI